MHFRLSCFCPVAQLLNDPSRVSIDVHQPLLGTYGGKNLPIQTDICYVDNIQGVNACNAIEREDIRCIYGTIEASGFQKI